MPPSKRMSKTLAAEIADRTLQVINPQNRGLALAAALSPHGFAGGGPAGVISDRQALIDWLLSTYAPKA